MTDDLKLSFSDSSNEKAMADLVRKHQSSLRSFIRMLGVQRDAVDDLAQESFLVAFREIDRLHPEEDFGKWLRGIARNLARREVDKSTRRSRILNTKITEHLIAVSEPDQTEAAYEENDLLALRVCLEDLPEKSQELINGRYTDEWDSTYLADQFKMSANAIRLALMRIRRSLKTCIEDRLRHA